MNCEEVRKQACARPQARTQDLDGQASDRAEEASEKRAMVREAAKPRSWRLLLGAQLSCDIAATRPGTFVGPPSSQP